MLKSIPLVILLSTAATAAIAAGGADQVAVNLAGIGMKPCAYWLSGPSHTSEGTVWIYGFWSGLNYVAAASEQDQSKATGAEMIATVERLCRREPSRVLASAAWLAYIDLNKNNSKK
jgi:hypothetical protein